jgi:hypothetical protein
MTPSVRAVEKLESSTSHSVSGFTSESGTMASTPRWSLQWPARLGYTLEACTVHHVAPRRSDDGIVGIRRVPASPVRDRSILQAGRENRNPCIGSAHQHRNRGNPKADRRARLGRLTSAAHEDVARTAVQKTQPTFEQQWVEVMLTSSTAERSTLCADYEIGLQLEPQEVRPSVRYGALRTGRPGHMSFGQTWSATASAWRRPQLDIARQALLNPAGTRSTLSEWIF